MTAFLLVFGPSSQAGLLSAMLFPVAKGSNVNLTAIGTLDWVHWGLYTDTDLNRKTGVLPQISNFTKIDAPSGYASVWRYEDNFNGYSWTDGEPVMTVDNTPTGVWAYDFPIKIGCGFRLTVPADTEPKLFKVFVGAFAGRGRFTASLSDGSANAYSNNGVSNFSNGPGGVYTIQYAANSPGQTLSVTYVLEAVFGPGTETANVTLQAATLSLASGNLPPSVTLMSPVDGANYAAGSDINLRAEANDADGSIVGVEFFAGETLLGGDDSFPYEFTWSGMPTGRYVVSAVATDNDGTHTTSSPVVVFVHGSGGTLAGGFSDPPASVNLTVEGESDWVHWGLSSIAMENRKAGVGPQIDGLNVLGNNEPLIYQDNFTSFAWTDGTPTVSTSGLPQGVFVSGLENGFEITASADARPRRLKVYVGLFGAASRMEAYLSDFSAMGYSDLTLSNAAGNAYGVYTFDYTAASAGQKLIVRYRSERLYDVAFGNVTLQAATLVGVAGPVPVTLLNPRLADGNFLFSFASQSDQTYQVDFSPTLDPPGWASNHTVAGTGGLVTVTNPPGGPLKGFYRVRSN